MSDKESNVSQNECEAPPTQHTSVVASHYNNLKDKGLKERYNSPIFYLRNFNNWVKSVLISEYISKIKEKDYCRHLKVLDICCGKGGDIAKWQKSFVDHVVFADIADVSIKQCQARYEALNPRQSKIFTAEFIAADCTKICLREKYHDPSIRFDLVSCQFGFHYSFESLTQARRMLMNISECLRPGGYFIGTIPNANEIVARAQKSPNMQFGNKVYNIKLLFDPKDGYPLFGAKYDFQLEGVVDCPEFLVYTKVFYELAREYDLEVVYEAGFEQFYKDHLNDHRQLLSKISSLESYPAPPGKELLGDEETDYDHVKTFLEDEHRKNQNHKVGTMAKSQWEVANIYMVFAMQKLKKTNVENGAGV
ncbi:mRNA cap guanine-N7 methyltransferase [Leptidea sinapis]|uniref:mRNA cap guanine-N(7) methyltransferase n=1 Tax=Leptidea sinapis TaxID=189913 RepID=A0A5E4QZ36_9NEOP|nr:mRNA cap guanine-N7 methyltransferase [Leptidea sinapis]VVD02363.1 unnamed protein product [Leptidea sinapis]